MFGELYNKNLYCTARRTRELYWQTAAQHAYHISVQSPLGGAHIATLHHATHGNAPLSLMYGRITDELPDSTNPISKPISAWI